MLQLRLATATRTAYHPTTLITFAHNLVAELTARLRGELQLRYWHRPQAGGNLLVVSLGASSRFCWPNTTPRRSCTLRPVAGGAEQLGRVRLPVARRPTGRKRFTYLRPGLALHPPTPTNLSSVGVALCQHMSVSSSRALLPHLLPSTRATSALIPSYLATATGTGQQGHIERNTEGDIHQRRGTTDADIARLRHSPASMTSRQCGHRHTGR